MNKPVAPFRAEDAAVEAPAGTPRREFLKATAAAAGATLLASCGGGGPAAVPAPVEAVEVNPLSRFDHLVVVMFENRSLDNMLGYLYPAGSPFNGLANGTYSNPVPAFINDGHASVTAGPSPGRPTDWQNPKPDPGEGFPHINTQLFGIVDPPSNQFEAEAKMTFPYNAPAHGTAPTMKGFVIDYCNNYKHTQKRNPTYDEYRVIMETFTSAQLPTLSKLAASFAVYDAWFCAVPSQTYCNRSFFHASTSSGFVLNAPRQKWLEFNDADTIFNRLQDAGRTWKIYFDVRQLASLTGLIHARKLAKYFKTNFAFMDQFYLDAAAGNLPDYTFIEPCMAHYHNDFHPPGKLVSDVRAGDLLLNNIYSAVRTSATPKGSNALNTMLLVTFDEAGGCFDHVPPGPARTPNNPQLSGEMDFLFDRLGVRVPTIAISAHTKAGTVVQNPVHHAAVIRTLCEKFSLKNLTNRDIDAPDIRDAINQPTVRDPSTWPVPPVDLLPGEALIGDPTTPEFAAQPMDELDRNIYALAMAHFTGVEPTEEEIPETVGESYARLKPLTAGQFGPG